MMEFTSRQLRAFLLVAQHQNFSRAAEALFITPSGLSLLIRELENQLGSRLFDRTTRHVALTAEASRLLPMVRRSLEVLDTALSGVAHTAKAASQSISVGASSLFAVNILPQAIKEFRLQRPEVTIQLFDGDFQTVLQRVEAGTLDMGLGWAKKSSGIRRTPFFRFYLMLIRPERDTTPRPTSTTWSALKGQRLISVPSTRM